MPSPLPPAIPFEPWVSISKLSVSKSIFSPPHPFCLYLGSMLLLWTRQKGWWGLMENHSGFGKWFLCGPHPGGEISALRKDLARWRKAHEPGTADCLLPPLISKLGPIPYIYPLTRRNMGYIITGLTCFLRLSLRSKAIE